jgi:hypothetical protein
LKITDAGFHLPIVNFPTNLKRNAEPYAKDWKRDPEPYAKDWKRDPEPYAKDWKRDPETEVSPPS